MTFQPTAWILLFATLFVGFFEQGCSPGGGESTSAAASESGKKKDGNKDDSDREAGTRDGEEDDNLDETPESTRDDRTDGTKIGRVMRGSLLSPTENDKKDPLQTMMEKVNLTTCVNTCIKVCSCNVAVWKKGGICQLSVADKVTFDEVVEEEDEVKEDGDDVEVKEDDEDVEEKVNDKQSDTTSSTLNGDRRMLNDPYAPAAATTPAPPQFVWIKNRCGAAIHNAKIAALSDVGTTEVTSDDEKMTLQKCQANCTAGCTAWEAPTEEKEIGGAGGYGRKENATTCNHAENADLFLEYSPISSDADPANYVAAGTTCQPDCSEKWLANLAFDNLYNNTLTPKKAIVVETPKQCMEACAVYNCTSMTYREKDGKIVCWATSKKGITLEDPKVRYASYSLEDYTFYAFKPTGMPPFKDAISKGRSNTADGLAVGAIVGGALAVVAVAVLAFVGFRAYKKHKGADADNATETGSVATSSPKSARKRQAIE